MAAEPEDSPRRRPRGVLENEVLAALGAAGEPLTAGEVLAQLDVGLAYTTVMTTLSRLYEKGAVTRERAGRAYAYAPADLATASAQAMLRALDTGENRAVVLARFLDRLAPEDEAVLQRLLDEAGG